MKASGQERNITEENLTRKSNKQTSKKMQQSKQRFRSADADCTINATEENKQSTSRGITKNALLLHP